MYKNNTLLLEDALKDEQDDSGIIVYDMHEDYSIGPSSKTKKEADKNRKTEASDSERKNPGKDSMARLGAFTGRVYDKLTYRTIEGAQIIIAKDLSVKTDERGIFTAVGVKPGRYRIHISEEGYVTQSRISIAVAGETTKIESFHLVPSCLAAEHPDDITPEEEKTFDHEIVQFAKTPVEETPGETTKLYADIVTPSENQENTVHDIESPGTMGDEKTIEYIKYLIDEELYAAFEKINEEAAGGENEILSVLIEQARLSPVIEKQPEIAISADNLIPAWEPSIAQYPPIPAISTIEDIAEPGGVSEAIPGGVQETFPEMKKDREETPQTPVMEEFHEEHPLFPLPEFVPEIVGVTVSQEPAQLSDPAQEPSVEKSRIGHLWKSLRNKIAKELELSSDIPLKTSAGETMEQSVMYQGQHGEVLHPLSDSTPDDTVGETASQTIAVEETVDKASPIDASYVKTGPSVIAVKSVEIVAPPFEEGATPEKPSMEDLFDTSAETEPVEEVLQEILLQEISGNNQEIIPEAVLQSIILEEYPGGFHGVIPEEMPGAITRELSIEETPVMSILSEETFEETRKGIRPAETSIDALSIPLFFEVLAENTTSMDKQEMFITETQSLEDFRGVPMENTVEEIPVPIETLTTGPEDAWKKINPKEALKDIHEVSLPEASEESPQEISIGEIPVAAAEREFISTTPVEATINETTQIENINKDTLEDKQQPKLQWWKLRKKKTQETSTEEPVGPSIDTTPQIIIGQKAPGVAKGKESPLHISSEEHKTALQKNTSESPSEETILPKRPSKSSPEKNQKAARDKQLSDPVAGKNAEEAAQQEHLTNSALETVSETTSPGQSPGETDNGTPLTGISSEKAISEEIPEQETPPLSDEEKAAMSTDDNEIEVAGFVGILNAQPNPAFKGLPITITYNLRNTSCDDPEDFSLQIIITNPDTGTVYETFETSVSCIKGSFSIGGFTIPTSAYEASIYRMTLQIVSKKTNTYHLIVDTPLQIKSIF